MPISLVQNFYKQIVTTPWTTGTGNFYVSVKPTVSAGLLVVSSNSLSLREIVRFTATGTDGGGDYVTVSERGLGGTTEQAHSSGEKVFMNITAEHIEEIDDALQALETDKIETSYLDTDVTLAANSDVKVATQKATKTYTDTVAATKVTKTGDETIAGVKTFSSSPIVPAPTTDLQVATKKYVDDIAVAGAPDAGLTTKGLVEQATASEVTAGTGTGSTSAPLFIDPATLLAFLRDAVEITTGTTHSLTTTAGQRVIVFATGGYTSAAAATHTASILYNGVTKQSFVTNRTNSSNPDGGSFALIYTEIPGAATADITVTLSSGTLDGVKIMVIKI